MGSPGIESRDQAGPGFSDVLAQVAKDAIQTTKSGETASMQAVEGKADLNQVVGAVTAAELTVQTVTAVRDRVISAYQEILRMPI
jgi:flagellar hook-basal body complex protein FliE